MVEPCRIKSFARLKRKAERFGWTVEEAINKAQDFIGFRLVCDNLQDVRRASELIRESLTRDGYKIRKADDYVAKPKKSIVGSSKTLTSFRRRRIACYLLKTITIKHLTTPRNRPRSDVGETAICGRALGAGHPLVLQFGPRSIVAAGRGRRF